MLSNEERAAFNRQRSPLQDFAYDAIKEGRIEDAYSLADRIERGGDSVGAETIRDLTAEKAERP